MAKLTRCPNGHFYDAERSPQCPYCAAPSAPAPPPPPDGSERTAPIQEEAMNRTAPIQENGIGRTVPLENAGTPVQRPASDWERKLLLAAAGMTGLSSIIFILKYFRWLLYYLF